jgi:hypothetical protein
MLDEQTAGKTAQRRDYDENEKTPIPPAIEHIASDKDEQVLPPQLLENKPVEQKHHRQKNHKCERVE